MDWNAKLEELRRLGVYPHVEQQPCGRTRRDGLSCRSWRMTAPFYNPDRWEPPACRKHMTEGELAQHYAALKKSAAIAHEQALAEPVACWAWPVTDHDRARSAAATACPDPDEAREIAWNLLRDWQDGHCAICGYRDHARVLDHDHATGLVRGWLCRSCNTSEGFDGHPDGCYGRYRRLHPARILDIRIQYFDPFTGAAVPEIPASLDENAEMTGVLAKWFFGTGT